MLECSETLQQHAWFLESRSSINNPKRDWYIWKKPNIDAEGNPQPPNNWSQILGDANSAWTFDDKTKEYYLSLFTPEQPDLNWENEEVREAIFDVMHFWLKRGVEGFRLDVINVISKHQDFPDAKIADNSQRFQPGMEFYANGPRLHEYLKQMHREVLSKYDAVTVGEMPWVSDEDEILRVVKSDEKELNMIFIFDIIDIDAIPGYPRFSIRDWQVKELRQIINRWQRIMIERDGWNSLFIENHDGPRSVSRYTDDSDEFRARGAKLLALMQTTLNGTLFVYQGEEIGMRNVDPSWEPEDFKDIESVNLWKKYQELYPNDPSKTAECRRALQKKSRDNSRTPMQWSDAPNAGFTAPGVKPWMRVNDDYPSINVEAQNSPGHHEGGLSVLQFWQRGLANRKQHKDAFVYGDFRLIAPEHDKVIAYVKTGAESGNWAVVLNFSGDRLEWEVPTGVEIKAWVAGNYTRDQPDKALSGKLTLEAWEGILGKCA